MLVLTAAGLDSMTKQIIRNTLPTLIQNEPKAKQGLETFVGKQLRGAEDESTGITGIKFLSRILAAESHQHQVIEECINSLTGSSLQSAEELMKAVASLGIDGKKDLNINPNEIKCIFDIRNKIIHELDINFEAPRRNRQSRKRDDMIDYTNTLLEVAEKLFNAVYSKLNNTYNPTINLA